MAQNGSKLQNFLRSVQRAVVIIPQAATQHLGIFREPKKKHGKKTVLFLRSHKTRKHPSEGPGIRGCLSPAGAIIASSEKWECLKIPRVPRSFSNVQDLCNIVGNNGVLGHPIQKRTPKCQNQIQKHPCHTKQRRCFRHHTGKSSHLVSSAFVVEPNLGGSKN